MRSRMPTSTAPAISLQQAMSYFVRLLQLVRPYWGRLSRGFSLGVIVSVVGLPIPYVSKLYFDNVYPSRDFSLLHILVVAAAVLALTSALLSALRGYYTQVIGSQLSSAVGLMYF